MHAVVHLVKVDVLHLLTHKIRVRLLLLVQGLVVQLKLLMLLLSQGLQVNHAIVGVRQSGLEHLELLFHCSLEHNLFLLINLI